MTITIPKNSPLYEKTPTPIGGSSDIAGTDYGVNAFTPPAPERVLRTPPATSTGSTPTPPPTVTPAPVVPTAPVDTTTYGYDKSGNKIAIPTGANLSDYGHLSSTKPSIPSPYPPEGNERVRRIGDINAQLTAGMQEKPDLETIRQDKAKQARILTDAIRSQYDRVFAGQKETNISNEARTRALNVNSGLAGSDFSTAAAVETEKKGKQAMDLIAAERDTKINAILADVENRASEQYQTQREQYMKDLEGDLTRQKALLEEDRTKAKEQIDAFVKGGYSYSSIKEKEPKVLEQLKKELGVSDLQMETLFTKSGAEKYLNAIKLDNGKVLMIKQGPDGKIVQSEYTTDLAHDETFKEIDGVPYGMKKDEKTGQINLRPIQGFVPNSKEALDLENKRLQNEKLRKDISETPGEYKFANDDKGKLIDVGLSSQAITNLEANIRANGANSVLSAISDPKQKEVLQSILSGTKAEDTKQFLTKDYFKVLFTEEQLKKGAEEAGLRSITSSWNTEKEKYLSQLENLVTQYRSAGYTDKEILKMMQ